MSITCVEWKKFALYLQVEKTLNKSDIPKYRSMFFSVRSYFNKRKWNKENLQLFLYDLLQSGKNPSYVNKYISFIRTHIESYLGTSFLRDQPSFDEEDKIFDVLDPEELQQLVKCRYPRRTKNQEIIENLSIRFDVAIEFAAFYALRFSELRLLQWSYVKGEEILIRRIKKKNIQKMPLTGYIRERLGLLEKHKHGYIFGSKAGQLKLASFNEEIKKRTTYLGIEKDITSHSLRRSFATTALDNDISPMKVARYLGHKNLNTLGQYYNNSSKLNREVLNSHPYASSHLTTEDTLPILEDKLEKWKNEIVSFQDKELDEKQKAKIRPSINNFINMLEMLAM